MKVMRGVWQTRPSLVSMDSRPVSYILSIQMRNSLIEFSTAWSVSLNPKGGTYASTGGSGNVTIHSAESSNFGERLETLSSGRNKFGMHCKHVRSLAFKVYRLDSLTGLLPRVRMDLGLRYRQRPGKYTYSTSSQALYCRRIHLTQ
jgi:hypothetical protein